MSPDFPAISKHILDACVEVKEGQRVWINTWDHTLKLAEDLAWECRRRGCETLLTVQPENLWLRSIIEAPKNLLDSLPAHLESALGETDVFIFTLGPRRPIPWEKIPAERRGSVSVWLDTRYDKSMFAEKWAQKARSRKLKMLGIEATLATPERAVTMGLDGQEWERVMFEGCTADPRAIADHGHSLEPILGGTGRVHITTPSGTDLTFHLKSRKSECSYGQVTKEMAAKGEVAFLPAGGIEVAVGEDSAEGKIVYDTTIRSGKGHVEFLTLQVAGGRVSQFSAKSGKEIFERYLEEGTKDGDRFSHFGFGLNPKLRLGFGQDDKVLGSTILGFGKGNAWWAAVTKATITVDEKIIMMDGRLVI